MSRLDSFIARMSAQRDGINFLKPEVDRLPGPIVEVGLGNGRTYDHLREVFPGRDIYVFETVVAAHPDCIPPADRLFLGDIRELAPEARRRMGAPAALVHCDLGTGDHAAHRAMAAWLGTALDTLCDSGSYIWVNQPLEVARWQRLPNPASVPEKRYYLYRVG